jgi:hypothetical protein
VVVEVVTASDSVLWGPLQAAKLMTLHRQMARKAVLGLVRRGIVKDTQRIGVLEETTVDV